MDKIFLLDNYDSFTYNLQHYLRLLDFDVVVKQNDEITIHEVQKINPAAMVLSPGPKTPAEAGLMMDVIRTFYDKIPILGICLGHQALGEFFELRLIHAERPVHGKTSLIRFKPHPVFENIPGPFQVMRYHSLILEENENVPLQFVAHTNERELMAFVHNELPIAGFQFHPESILTPDGMHLLKNWKKWIVSKR